MTDIDADINDAFFGRATAERLHRMITARAAAPA
ncbi:hypothetical protein QFZ82_007005 [Streptomyces sp. V4I23]|nr:hypothetical protein [Streptomyces sp. V4I23]